MKYRSRGCGWDKILDDGIRKRRLNDPPYYNNNVIIRVCIATGLLLVSSGLLDLLA